MNFGIGKLLALPVRIANIPARAMEKLVDATDGQETPEEDRIISMPLAKLAEAIEELDK